ncbi:MAG: GNAT family N-acetyltransferase [Vicinamibacterales bacterium]
MLHLVPAEGRILETILAETHTIWHDRLPLPAFHRWWAAQLRTPWGERRLRRLALVDGHSVIASVKVYDFDAVLDGERIAICGLGAVFTQAAYRGHGHGRTLITRVLDQAASRGQQMALLFSEIGVDYYARIGFVPVPAQDAILHVADPPQRGAPATLVRAGDERDFDAIVTMGRLRAAPFRFHLERDRTFVHYAIAKQRLRAGLAPHGTRELQFFVAEEGASAAAYVILGVEADVWTMLECGDRDPTGARVGAMLQVLIAREPTARPRQILGRLAPGMAPPQVTIVARHPTREQMMMRPLDGATVTPPLEEDDVLYWRTDLF